MIERHMHSGWYDYSDHERSEYNKSLSVFKAATAFTNGYHHLKGAEAIKVIIRMVQNACEIQAKNNSFYQESFERKHQSKITTIEQAVDQFDNCLFTGVCTDFYLTDTLKSFVLGEKYQDLNLGELLEMAVKNSRIELNKQCRYYKTKGHTKDCLREQCEDWFYENGDIVPESLLNQVA